MMRAAWLALPSLIQVPVLAGAIVLVPSFGPLREVTRQQEPSASYRVSRVTVEGASEFRPDQVVRLSKLKTGQVLNGPAIARARAAILRAYANRGRIQARVQIQQELKPPGPAAQQGVVAVRIEITEGAVFLLRRLEFIGNATTRDTIVRRRVLQQEGEPYSQELMEKSVARLNDLGRFEILTMADIEMRVDEKEHFVDLVVHLKEINRSQTRR